MPLTLSAAIEKLHLNSTSPPPCSLLSSLNANSALQSLPKTRHLNHLTIASTRTASATNLLRPKKGLLNTQPFTLFEKIMSYAVSASKIGSSDELCVYRIFYVQQRGCLASRSPQISTRHANRVRKAAKPLKYRASRHRPAPINHHL